MLGNGKFPRKFDSPDDFLKNLSGELPLNVFLINLNLIKKRNEVLAVYLLLKRKPQLGYIIQEIKINL